MEASDAAELISEIREERAENEADNHFRDRAAMLIAIFAMLLAVGSLGGGNVAEDMIHNNIKASDTWAFYQAKNVRQTQYRIAVDQMQAQLAADAGLPPQVRADMQATVDKYKATIARYDDEPDPEAPDDPLRGEGKKQLTARARDFEAQRDVAVVKDDNFDYAEVALQLALVLGSVAILATNRAVLIASGILGVIGAVLMINGFALMFELPF
jgi:hypothetical protein